MMWWCERRPTCTQNRFGQYDNTHQQVSFSQACKSTPAKTRKDPFRKLIGAVYLPFLVKRGSVCYPVAPALKAQQPSLLRLKLTELFSLIASEATIWQISFLFLTLLKILKKGGERVGGSLRIHQTGSEQSREE
jgi:hypothetical protein